MWPTPVDPEVSIQSLTRATGRSDAGESEQSESTRSWDGRLPLARSARDAILDGCEGAEVEGGVVAGNHKVSAPDAAGGQSGTCAIDTTNHAQEALGDVVDRGWVAGVPTSQVWNGGGGR